MTRSMINVWVKYECEYVYVCMYVCLHTWRCIENVPILECNESVFLCTLTLVLMLFRCHFIWTWTAHPFFYAAMANQTIFFAFFVVANREYYMHGKLWEWELKFVLSSSMHWTIARLKAIFWHRQCGSRSVCARTFSFPLANPMCSHCGLFFFILSKLTVLRSRCQHTSTLDRIYYWLDFSCNMLLNLSHIGDGFVMDFIIERG